MSAIEIVAYIGAAAWLPHVITWIYRSLIGPALRLVPGSNLMLSYMTKGSTVILNCSISTKRKNALIDKIKLQFIHENGDQREFEWAYLEEIPFQIRGLTEETGVDITRNQPAIALKILTFDLVERSVTFFDLVFEEEQKRYAMRAEEQYNYLKKLENPLPESLLKSKQYLDWAGAFQSGMYWRQGRYDVKICIREAEKKSWHYEQFKIKLTSDDIEHLKLNCNNFEQSILSTFQNDEEKQAEEKRVKEPNWYSVTPAVIK